MQAERRQLHKQVGTLKTQLQGTESKLAEALRDLRRSQEESSQFQAEATSAAASAATELDTLQRKISEMQAGQERKRREVWNKIQWRRCMLTSVDFLCMIFHFIVPTFTRVIAREAQRKRIYCYLILLVTNSRCFHICNTSAGGRVCAWTQPESYGRAKR